MKSTLIKSVLVAVAAIGLNSTTFAAGASATRTGNVSPTDAATILVLQKMAPEMVNTFRAEKMNAGLTFSSSAQAAAWLNQKSGGKITNIQDAIQAQQDMGTASADVIESSLKGDTMALLTSVTSTSNCSLRSLKDSAASPSQAQRQKDAKLEKDLGAFNNVVAFYTGQVGSTNSIKEMVQGQSETANSVKDGLQVIVSPEGARAVAEFYAANGSTPENAHCAVPVALASALRAKGTAESEVQSTVVSLAGACGSELNISRTDAESVSSCLVGH